MRPIGWIGEHPIGAAAGRTIRVGSMQTGDNRTLLGRNPLSVESLSAYVASGGYRALERSGVDLLAAIGESELAGRGGGAFPTALKLQKVMSQPPSRRVVVANGAETEPNAFKDRFLMRFRPHLVLEGALLAARIVDADIVFVYVSDAQAEVAIRAALKERTPDIRVNVSRASQELVSGEETAVVNSINGMKALPKAKPPRPFTSGVAGFPTLILNVETLCHIALIASAVADEGSNAYSPTLLTTTTSLAMTPHLIETSMGVSVADFLQFQEFRLDEISALMPGGYFGGILAPPFSESLKLEGRSLREAGVGLGTGSFIVVRTGDCPVGACADAAAYLAGKNAGQCGSCMNGTAAAAATLRAICDGSGADDHLDSLLRWAGQLPGRGACGVPDGLARLLASLLEHFDETLVAHIGEKCTVCSGRSFDYGESSYSLNSKQPVETLI